METQGVVIKQLIAQESAHADKRMEEVRVKHFAPKRAIEALGIGVLGGLILLNLVLGNGVQFVPVGEANADEFGAVAGALLHRAAVALDQLGQHLHDPGGGQRGSKLGAQ